MARLSSSVLVSSLDKILDRAAAIVRAALERQRFADLFLLGTGTPGSLSWPAVSAAYESAKQNTYALDLAKVPRTWRKLTRSSKRPGYRTFSSISSFSQPSEA